MNRSFELMGWFADFDQQNFYFGRLVVKEGWVKEIVETGRRRLTWEERAQMDRLILPGLVDSHVHIESSMLTPYWFAQQAVRFGTVATVSDPHEIANVLGLDGIRFMLKNAEKACIKINFTAPSCVPATALECAGAVLNAADLEPLFAEDSVVALGEMMNYPGVLFGDGEVKAKIEMARRFGKPVDGHAPGLSGPDLDIYIRAGINTDHECFTIAEAEEKIAKGMKVLIREGSSARNFEQLYPIIDKYPEQVMLCTDDYHPDDLMVGHIDRLIRQGVDAGVNFFNIYRAASLNPVEHYRISTGFLRPGDPADFVVAEEVDPLKIIATYINGVPVFAEGKVLSAEPEPETVNAFHAMPVKEEDLVIPGKEGKYRVIRVYDGELITGAETAYLSANKDVVLGNVDKDILKIVVVNRYKPAKPSVAWITGFGMKKGAMASSIAHDSHNIIAVGTSDSEIASAINGIIRHHGGIAAVDNRRSEVLPLPIAGLMSTDSAPVVGKRYAELTRMVREMGSPLKAPFMALSFMALLVIPHLKIGDRGLFNCDKFEFTDLKVD